MEPNLSIVERYEGEFGKPAAFRQAIQFMVAYMTLMRSELPAPARRALEVARQFYYQTASVKELEAAEEDCWKFLREKSPGDDVNTPEVFAVKAAMRLLYLDPENSDIYDIVYYFLKMADRFEDHSEELDALLLRFFSEPR